MYKIKNKTDIAPLINLYALKEFNIIQHIYIKKQILPKEKDKHNRSSFPQNTLPQFYFFFRNKKSSKAYIAKKTAANISTLIDFFIITARTIAAIFKVVKINENMIRTIMLDLLKYILLIIKKIKSIENTFNKIKIVTSKDRSITFKNIVIPPILRKLFCEMLTN